MFKVSNTKSQERQLETHRKAGSVAYANHLSAQETEEGAALLTRGQVRLQCEALTQKSNIKALIDPIPGLRNSTEDRNPGLEIIPHIKQSDSTNLTWLKRGF